VGTNGTDQAVPQRPYIEWAVGLLSATLVICLATYLLYEAAFGTVMPADVRVTVESIEATDGGINARIAVRNHGDKAAAGIVVRATLMAADGPDTRQIEFDYVAGQSVRYGAIVLPQETSASDLRIDIGGYVEP
jgi:uncharacterized protein (TIGR02588 family)